MDDTAFLHGRIESYAGYTNDAARQRSDEQIRAYVGEALTQVRARLSPTSEALERLLLRCEFANQGVAHAFDASDVPAAEIAATAAADRKLVALADRSREVDAAELEAFLAQIDAAFNQRWRDAADAAQPSAEPPAR